MKKYLILISLFLPFLFTLNTNASQYPNTSLAVIDINIILNESKVAIDANEQIEKITIKIDEDLSNGEKLLIDEQKKLIESQQIMAPEAFEEKRIEYDKKVQDFQIKSQEKLVKLDRTIALVRAKILDELKPILEKISEEKGITVILEKSSVILNADNMDITKLVIKELNKNLPEIKVELEE